MIDELEIGKYLNHLLVLVEALRWLSLATFDILLLSGRECCWMD